MIKWKLIHEHHHLFIANEHGMTLGYNPNSGIKIMEEDGFAFKDLNNDGKLSAMEDWRLPLKDRVEDFKKTYRVMQLDNTIYYKKGTLRFSQDVSLDVLNIRKDVFETLSKEANMNEQYVKENYILIIMIMMFDKDDENALQDYMIQTFIQAIDHGVLDHLVFSITKSIRAYIQQHFHQPSLQM